MKHLQRILLALFLLSQAPAAFAMTAVQGPGQQSQARVVAATHLVEKGNVKAGKFVKWLKKTHQKASDSDGLVAALICLVIGWTGIHRVFLGGRPILILLYIITLGGIFGILPLIDFFRLLFGNVDHYRDNDDFLAAFKS